jgi:hypothetical protein
MPEYYYIFYIDTFAEFYTVPNTNNDKFISLLGSDDSSIHDIIRLNAMEFERFAIFHS